MYRCSVTFFFFGGPGLSSDIQLDSIDESDCLHQVLFGTRDFLQAYVAPWGFSAVSALPSIVGRNKRHAVGVVGL